MNAADDTPIIVSLRPSSKLGLWAMSATHTCQNHNSTPFVCCTPPHPTSLQERTQVHGQS